MKLCASIREDYVRNEGNYDHLLSNPRWIISPTIAFVEGKGPIVLICRDHDGGTSKLYIHPPRTASILPAPKGDQLCHVVARTRCLKPIKASMYNTSF